MFCSKCGKELNPEAKFCDNCGSKIDDNQATNENSSSVEGSKDSNWGCGVIVVIIGVIAYIVYLVYSYSSYGATDMAKDAINEGLEKEGISTRIEKITNVRKIGEYEEAVYLFNESIPSSGDLYKGLAYFTDGSKENVCFYRTIGDTKMAKSPDHADLRVVATFCE